jgi:hypothetical protein
MFARCTEGLKLVPRRVFQLHSTSERAMSEVSLFLKKSRYSERNASRVFNLVLRRNSDHGMHALTSNLR